MDKQEAKLVLQTIRPNSRDAKLAVFTEALALVKRDSNMKAWWESQRAFDRKVAAKLSEVPIPTNLRMVILAGHKIEQLTPRYPVPQSGVRK